MLIFFPTAETTTDDTPNSAAVHDDDDEEHPETLSRFKRLDPMFDSLDRTVDCVDD